MARNKKPRKKYVPRKIDLFLMAASSKVFTVIEPIQKIIKQLEMDGTIDIADFIDDEGREYINCPIFTDENNGQQYAVVQALEGVIGGFEILETRKRINLKLGNLRNLSKKIEKGELIDSLDTKYAKESLELIKKAAFLLRESEALDLVKTFQIKNLNEEILDMRKKELKA